MAHSLFYEFGELGDYQGPALGDVHKDLVHLHGLKDLHFDRLVSHLQVSMQDLQLPQEIIHHVLNVAENYRSHVLRG